MNKYHDIDGNKISLYKLVRKEPEWAQSRIENSIHINDIKKIKFPVALRKMWSGGEVQEWLERELQKLIDKRFGIEGE